MVFNVVDERSRVVVIQDTFVGKKMFDKLIEDDKNLTFLGDIGFKYISAITVEMNNDTYDVSQNIILITMDGKTIVKRVQFFILSKNLPSRYILASSRFENKTFLSLSN